MAVADIASMEADFKRDAPDIVVLTVPAEAAQEVLDRVVRSGVKAVLNFAPTQLQAPADVTVKTVNMAMELEGLSFALTNRDD
jgi:redox-sensing transcriptional repressor